MSTVEATIQAVIALLVITNPIDPVKILIFNGVVEKKGLNRKAAAAKLGVMVGAILVGAVLIGREFLDLLGINLGAFGFVGGLIVAGMGFEMLYAGRPSRAQGADEMERAKEGDADEENGLVIPLTIPLMAGPGALTTAITIASTGDQGTAVIAGTVAALLMGSLAFLGMAYVGGLMAKASPELQTVLQRIGGLLLATIGAQLTLGGIRTFYA